MLALTEFLLLFVSHIPCKHRLRLVDFSTMARLRCKGLIEKLIKGFISDPPKGCECNKNARPTEYSCEGSKKKNLSY